MKLSDAIEKEIRGQWGDELEKNQTGIPVIKTNNMTYEGKLDLSSLTFRSITKEKAEKSYLKYGDLLIEKSGGTKTHSVGYVNFFDNVDKKYVPNNFILSLRPNKSITNPLYLFYQLRYKYESGSIDDLHNQTTGIQNLYVDKYLKQQIKIPLIKEQDSVVFLLQKIENDIARERESISSLNELIKSRFIEMFSQTYKTKKWSEVVKIINGKDYKKIPNIKGTYPIYGSGGYMQMRCDEYLTKENSVIIGRKGNVTNPLFIKEKYWNVDTAFGIEPGPELDPLYFYYFSLTINLEDMVTGATIPSLAKTQLLNLMINIPPIELQNEFASFVKQVDKLKFNVQKRIDLYQELLDKKMDEYFN